MQGRISNREARAEVKPRIIKASSGEPWKQREDDRQMRMRDFRIRNGKSRSQREVEARADYT